MSEPFEVRLPKFLKFQTHVKKRSFWLGSSIATEKMCWMRTGKIFKKEIVAYSDALLKCFDEILVNAIDQYINSVRCPESLGGPVTYIKVHFNKKTGMITITNDGIGIPVRKIEGDSYGDNTAVQGKYTVEALITTEFGGSNFDDDVKPDRVTGGINGLGMKLVNINSAYFEVETVDTAQSQYYHQVCKNSMEEILPPVVIDFTKLGKPGQKTKLTAEQMSSHTTIRFIPAYDKLCQKTKGVPDPDWCTPENMEGLSKLIEFRVYQTAAFVGSIAYRYDKNYRIDYATKAAVYYNNELVKINKLSDFVEMFGVKDPLEAELSHSRSEMFRAKEAGHPGIRFPWYFCIGITPKKKHEYMSIVNGVYISNGGDHCAMMVNQLYELLTPKIEAFTKSSNFKFTKDMLKNILFVFDCRQIPIPSFASQTKESFKLGKEELADMKLTYIIPDKIINQLWKMLKERIKGIICEKEIKESSKKRKNNIHVRKYHKAQYLGSKSILFVPEGDSAEDQVRDMIYSKESPLDFHNCGRYNIQGVPMNARKKIEKVLLPNGKPYIRQHRKLANNVGLQGLAHVIGLDYNKDYYFGPPDTEPDIAQLDDEQIDELYKRRERGDEDVKELNYGKIIFATDQDLDGVGHISSLLLVYIMIFWPNIIKRGLVGRLLTPYIRVYHKQNSWNMYSKKEYVTWCEKKFGGEDKKPKAYETKYYKGLGTHSPEEIAEMGTNMLENIYIFSWDDACEAALELVYGPGTEGRKVILSTPVDREYNERLFMRQEITCSDHFFIESKSFQHYFVRRMLKSAIDGFIPSQRKAFAGIRRRNVKKNKPVKVYQLTGYVTESMSYMHGDSSMNEAIIKMAQTFTGANNIPPLIPISNGFGSRVKGRGSSASPRYIDIQYNSKVMDLMFPREDDYLLEYEYYDGKRCEPTFYVPILPYSILETSTTAGVAWKISCWGRDLEWTLYNLKQMINHGHQPLSFQGHAWLPTKMTNEIGTYTSSKRSSEICHGAYHYDEDENSIIITQLPIKVWSHNLRCAITGVHPKTEKSMDKDGEKYPRKELAVQCIDHTANDKNNIIIKLREGAMEEIIAKYGNDSIDPVEDYFELTKQMLPELNMIVEDGTVNEFKTYEDIMTRWFPLRKKLYEIRLQRQQILLRLKIGFNKNVLRFIHMDATKEINIDKDFEDDERNRILVEALFDRYDKGTLAKPLYIRTDKLEELIVAGPNANYEYINDITIRMKSKTAVTNLEKKIIKLEEKLRDLEKHNWKTLWLREIEAVESAIKEGIKTKWLFGKKQHIYKRAAKEK